MGVMLFTEKPEIPPKAWEPIEIPDYVLDAMIDYTFPPGWIPLSDSEQAEIAHDVDKFKKRWLGELKEKGFTAVKMESKNDSIFAEATRDPVKKKTMIGRGGYFSLDDLSDDEIKAIEDVAKDLFMEELIKIPGSVKTYPNRMVDQWMDNALQWNFSIEIGYEEICKIVNGMRARV
jgi:hypothetical protein